MIYEFRRVLAGDRLSSEVIEEDMPYEAAPPIGGRIKLGGKLLQRIASMPPAKVEGDFHFMSRTAPRWWSEHKKRGGKFSKKGHPLFESKKQVRELDAVGRDIGGMRHEELAD